MSNERYRFLLKRLGADPREMRTRLGAEGTRGEELEKMIAAEMQANPMVDYADALRMIARSVPQGGFDENEMRKAVALIRIVDAAEIGQANEVVVPADVWAWFQGRLAAFRFVMAHQNILAFIDDVRAAAKETPPEEAKS